MVWAPGEGRKGMVLEEAVEVGAVGLVLEAAVFLELGLGVEFGGFHGDGALAFQDAAAPEREESVQTLDPVFHGHGDVAFGLVLGVVEVSGDDAGEAVELVLGEVVFGHADVVLLYFAFWGVFPRGQAHVRFGGVGASADELGGGLAGDGIVEFVLDVGEEGARGGGGGVVVECRGVDVGYFLVEAAFGEADLADFLEELVEVTRGEARAAVLEALVIHGPTFDGVVADNGVGPFPKLDGARAADLETDGDDGLKAVVCHLAGDWAGTLLLNYSKISNSCLL